MPNETFKIESSHNGNQKLQNDKKDAVSDNSTSDTMIEKKDIKDKTQPVSFTKRLRRDTEYRHKFIHTMVLCWSFVTYGWIAGMTGPTFPDLRQLINEDLATSTWMFTVGSFGFMVGSLGGGALFDRINKEALLAVSFFGTAVVQFVTPYCRMLATMLVVRFFVGIFCGVVDTGGNADIYYVWGKDGGSYMQALHFGFSVGALLAPLATEPFLAKKLHICEDNMLQNKTTVSSGTTQTAYVETQNSINNKTMVTGVNVSVSCTEIYEESNVHWAFVLSAILCLLSSVAFVFLLCCSGNVYKPITSETSQEDKKQAVKNKRKKLTTPQTVFFLVMVCLQISSYAIIEDTFAGFLMTFCLAHLDWDKRGGSFATAAFWISFAIGRFLGIFITKFCKQSFMLTFYLILMAISLVGFYIGVKIFYIPVIWIFTIMLGFSMSVIFPALFSWTSKYVMPVKGKVSSIIFTCLILTGMGFPVLMGNMMEYFGPMWFVYILLMALVYCLIHFTVLRVLVRVFILTKTKAGDINEQETEIALVK